MGGLYGDGDDELPRVHSKCSEARVVTDRVAMNLVQAKPSTCPGTRTDCSRKMDSSRERTW